jgi:glycosyltransferase involved in cell wall biosynthesis
MRKLQRFLAIAKNSGIRIIWTYHNIEPHEKNLMFDRIGYSLMSSAADLIICHDEHSRRACIERHNPACKVVVMCIGNYEGVYPKAAHRSTVVRRLGLDPELPLVSSIGAMRGYKGLDVGCRAIAALGGRVQYVVAGQSQSPRLARQLQSTIRGVSSVKIIPRALSDQEFADLSAASDVIILPYRKVTGSSALLAALTFHRGVIASDLPFFREILAEEPDAGRLVAPDDFRALSDAIVSYLNQVPEERREAAACRLSDRFRWEDVVTPVTDAIGEWRSRDGVT